MYVQLEADRNAAIHNALMSGDSSEAKQLAINSPAEVAGTSAAGIAAGIGKSGVKKTETGKSETTPISLGRGSKDRTEPNTLNEKLSMDQVMSNPSVGRQLPVPMTDPRRPQSDGWVKMSQNVNSIEVHYVRNKKNWSG